MIIGSCFCQAEDGIRDLVRSRGLGDVYKRQRLAPLLESAQIIPLEAEPELREALTPWLGKINLLSLIHI